MYYIDDYRQRAVEKVIPYLIEFPQIVKILEINADRYQAIEDIMWQIANNFELANARGIFLEALANNEVVDFEYTDKAQDAFTYGTTMPLYQAYGTGHYYSQSSYISGIKKSVSEEKTIRAIKSQIIQNNTNASVEDLMEALKLLYNADQVKIYESDPLNLSIMLIGSQLEISSSGNYENIKKMLPACVSFNNIFVDTSIFDLFMYDENSSYGDTRYPIRIGETVDIYNYISFSINLDSEFKEHIKTNYNKFDENNFCCITGEITKLNNNAILFSSTNIETGDMLSFKIVENISEENTFNFGLDYNGDTQLYNTPLHIGDRYTIIIENSDTQLKAWVIDGIPLKGKYSEDRSYLYSRIINLEPNIVINNFVGFEAPIYINCLYSENGAENFGDFTYYAILFGSTEADNVEFKEYYASCYGEKQILFNCLENKNHLYITTNNPLVSNIMRKQSYYNYKETHSNGKYVYLDGKSGIDYNINEEDIECDVDKFDLSFDICMPISITSGDIFSNFIGTSENGCELSITTDNSLKLTAITDTGLVTYETPNDIISADEYASFRILYDNNILAFYKNKKLLISFDVKERFHNIPKKLKIGFNEELSSFYKGFIKNINLSLTISESIIEDEDEESGTIEPPIVTETYEININLPFKNTLRDTKKELAYTNFGARFITTPQLINNTDFTDLYGNDLISKRIPKQKFIS